MADVGGPELIRRWVATGGENVIKFRDIPLRFNVLRVEGICMVAEGVLTGPAAVGLYVTGEPFDSTSVRYYDLVSEDTTITDFGSTSFGFLTYTKTGAHYTDSGTYRRPGWFRFTIYEYARDGREKTVVAEAGASPDSVYAFCRVGFQSSTWISSSSPLRERWRRPITNLEILIGSPLVMGSTISLIGEP